MGADLYIRKVFDPNKRKYEPLFDEAVKKRERAKTQAMKDRHQKDVDKYYDLMFGKGYFRDSYNEGNVLWKLGMSYWRDFPCFMNKKQMMSPEKAKTLLCLIEKRDIDMKGMTPEDKKWFAERKNEMIAFLKSAIKLNSSIECSI